MSEVGRKWDVLSGEERNVAVKKIIAYFRDERDEEIGLLATEQLLDFFLEEIGLKIQNNTMKRDKNWFKEHLESTEFDFDELAQ
ncbi:MAG: DUF2164 family protein [Candidatus Magasanikbacteria bacterium]|nr:DUF2164 family protein [Candidatus Magasanikbacteria bacterium]